MDIPAWIFTLSGVAGFSIFVWIVVRMIIESIPRIVGELQHAPLMRCPLCKRYYTRPSDQS